MTPLVSLRESLADPNLLGDALAGDSWSVWRALLIAAMGEGLTDDERVIFRNFTGRDREPAERVEELEVVAGRRGGKSRAISVLAAYLASLCDYRDRLVPGERGVLLIIAPDQRQAAITLDYAVAVFEQSPMLKRLIATRSNDALSLTNGIDLEVRAASFRRLRGPTYIGVIADEAAFWYSDDYSANADAEILAAVRPGLATTKGLLAIISSPYARKGEVWDTYRRHYGANGDPLILVARGASRDFNPTLPQSVVDRAVARDPASAAAEYMAEFRSDIDGFVSLEAVEGCVGGYRELPPARMFNYYAFVDPSGGSEDSFTICIAHRDGDNIFVDCVRERCPPFSPEDVIIDFAKLCGSYRVSKVVGDHYGGEFPRELFRKQGLLYEPAKVPKSDLYRDLLPLLNSGRIILPKHERLIGQIVGLERRVGRSGRDSIDHAPHCHDDLANAVAGAADCARSYGGYDTSYRAFQPDADDDPTPTAAQHASERAADYVRAFARMNGLFV